MKRLKILVADKDDLLREKIAGVISRFKEVLLVAQIGGGDDLINVLEEVNPNIFLIDAVMAVHEFKTMFEIKRLYPEIKIHLISEDHNSYYNNLSKSMGATSAIMKDNIFSEMKLIIALAMEDETEVKTS